jgi:hypothetical protein
MEERIGIKKIIPCNILGKNCFYEERQWWDIKNKICLNLCNSEETKENYEMKKI